jgi:hypothetical protein
LLIGRYHFPNPGQITPSWQDIYLWTPGQPAERLSRGAFPGVERDYTGFSAMAGRRVLFASSGPGGTDVTLGWMGIEDVDGDQQGDPYVELATGPLDLGTPVLRDGRVVMTVLDTDGDAQVGLASLSITMAGSSPVTTISDFVALTADPGYPDGYSFVSADRVIYGVDGDGLAFIDLPGGTATPAPVPLQFVREPTVPASGDRVIFSALQGGSLDLFEAAILPGPGLGAPQPLFTTPDANESGAAISPDGRCLAWVSTPRVDANGDPVVGPYADIFVRDETLGQQLRMTVTRDIASVDWYRP